jgi:hypothetical protein
LQKAPSPPASAPPPRAQAPQNSFLLHCMVLILPRRWAGPWVGTANVGRGAVWRGCKGPTPCTRWLPCHFPFTVVAEGLGGCNLGGGGGNLISNGKLLRSSIPVIGRRGEARNCGREVIGGGGASTGGLGLKGLFRLDTGYWKSRQQSRLYSGFRYPIKKIRVRHHRGVEHIS